MGLKRQAILSQARCSDTPVYLPGKKKRGLEAAL